MIFTANQLQWFRRAAKTQKWLVAVSGGADSMALLHLLLEHGFRRLVICHLNHQLRGAAAGRDADFVQECAKRLELPCELGRADVATVMAQSRESLESAARTARHEFFANCARSHECSEILIAHHADDQAETVLWNLLRGSHGLVGMKHEQSMLIQGQSLHLIRPLLGIQRESLRAWLLAKQILWREDATNREPLGVRNRLRNEVMPLLQEITARHPAEMLPRALAGSNELREIQTWALNQIHVTDPQGRIHLPTLRTLPLALQKAALVEFLKSHQLPIQRADVERCLVLLSASGPPAVTLAGGVQLRRRAGRLLLCDTSEDGEPSASD